MYEAGFFWIVEKNARTKGSGFWQNWEEKKQMLTQTKVRNEGNTLCSMAENLNLKGNFAIIVIFSANFKK